MPDRRYRGSPIDCTYPVGPWARDGETVSAPGDTDREAGEERTEGEVDTDAAIARLDDRDDQGDGDDRDADAAESGLESAAALFVEVVATAGPREPRARLLRPSQPRSGRSGRA